MIASAVDTNQQYSGLVYLSEMRADEEFDIGVKDIGDLHPLTELMGFEAPPDWWALGTVGTAWMASYAGDADFERGLVSKRPSQMPTRQRVVTSLLVARDGAVASCVRHGDGSEFTEPPTVGAVPDALKRCLGLPTPPPEAPPADFFIVLWLHFVDFASQEARANLQKMTWVRAARCFPSLAEAAGRDLHDVAAFADAAMRAVSEIDWSALRRWGTHGSLGSIVSPDLARWMDDGMFSRHVMAELPLVATQLEKTCFRLNPAVSNKVRAAVDALLLRATAAAA